MTMTDTPQTPSIPAKNRRRLIRFGLAAVVIFAVAAGGFIWWFLRDDAPEEVSLDTAAQVLRDDADSEAEPDAAVESAGAPGAEDESTATETPPATETPAADPTAAIVGTWNVDTSIGEFSFEDSTGSFVGFRVEEELSTIGTTTAVGRTPVVSGTIVIEGTTLIEATIEADMSRITTNDARRDNRVAGALESDIFPTGTFELLSPIDLGDGAAAGDPISVEAVGSLTVHGVTNEVVFDLQAQLIDDVVVVVGSTDIEFADYGVSVPTAPIVLSADEFGVVEFQLLFTR